MDFRGKQYFKEIPLITIGVLSYNNSPFINDTLDSIYSQSYTNIELIIVDDCSSDVSLNIINEWIKKNNVSCNLIVHNKNYGICRTCNDVIKNASGKYVSLFGSDDVMDETRVEKLVRELEEAGDEYALCHSSYEAINDTGESLGIYNEEGFDKEGEVFDLLLERKIFIAAPSVLIRKRVYERVGFYDERVYAEDYGMWMKLLPLYKVKFCPYPVVKYRVREVQKRYTAEELKRRIERYHKDRIYIYIESLKVLKGTTKWQKQKADIQKKVNFHLMRLQQCRSSFFTEMFWYLLKNFFWRLSFKSLIINRLRQFSPSYKENYHWNFE